MGLSVNMNNTPFPGTGRAIDTSIAVCKPFESRSPHWLRKHATAEPRRGIRNICCAGDVGFVLSGAACQRARNRSGFPFGSLRSTFDRTLARLPNYSARKRRRDFDVSRGQVHFFPFFPNGDKTGAERETGQA